MGAHPLGVWLRDLPAERSSALRGIGPEIPAGLMQRGEALCAATSCSPRPRAISKMRRMVALASPRAVVAIESREGHFPPCGRKSMVLARLRLLHERQSGWMLRISLEPPRESGTTWSGESLISGSTFPQHKQARP